MTETHRHRVAGKPSRYIVGHNNRKRIVSPKALSLLHVKWGWSYRRIAKKYGYKIGGIQDMIIRYGIRSNYSKKIKRNKRIRAKAISLICSGKKAWEVARILPRVPLSTIHYWFRAAGIKTPGGGWLLSKTTRRKMSLSRREKLHPRWKGDMLNRICAQCETTFRKKNDRKEPARGKIFCSRKCSQLYQIGDRHPCWRGGCLRHRGGLYTIWARTVIQRDRGLCKRCGADRKIQAHHIRPWAKFPEFRYRVRNGITLCVKCHRHVHSSKLKPWIIVA
jgi:5-methylcytosine-specific restriction endonuclease McrA